MPERRRRDYESEAKSLLASPYCIAPGPEAETAIPIIKGLLNEIKGLKNYINQIGG